LGIIPYTFSAKLTGQSIIARSPVGSGRSSILKADSYKAWDWNTKVALQQLIQGIPNRKVVLDNRIVILNESHAMIVQSFLDNPELSVEERAEHLGYNCDNFNCYLRELYAYGKNHHVSAAYRRNGIDLTKYVQGGHQK
jgi:hypothetical protein